MCHDCPFKKAKSGDTITQTVDRESLEMFPHLPLNRSETAPQPCHNMPLRECAGHIVHINAGTCTSEIIQPGTMRTTLL